MEILSFFLVALLAGVHFSVKYFTQLVESPRNPLLSFAGGASIGYITVHLLPDFQKIQEEFNLTVPLPRHIEEYSLYLIATTGFLAFFIINHFVRSSHHDHQEQQNRTLLFIVHIAAFALYNSFIGYYLVKGLKQEPKTLIMFTVVFILHLMVNDVGLRLDHKKRYGAFESATLAVAIFGGWLLGIFITLPTAYYGVWFSWLAGGILLNTIKEELPSERKSKILPFVFGLLFSTTLFLFM
ncbi:MAG TPA: hypothetical protein DCR24_13300 [Bacillus bacterium]|nr:hypothetical protein [Bacillus sp. (in: firmicutes)]